MSRDHYAKLSSAQRGTKFLGQDDITGVTQRHRPDGLTELRFPMAKWIGSKTDVLWADPPITPEGRAKREASAGS